MTPSSSVIAIARDPLIGLGIVSSRAKLSGVL